MEVFTTKLFSKWAKNSRITDKSLIKIATEIEQGLIDAELGSNLIKKRIPSKGHGRRGGARMILAYKVHEKIFFLFGFEKNKYGNITKKELRSLKKLGKTFLEMPKNTIKKLVKHKEILELKVSKNDE